MVAADEIILLIKQSGKHCRRRTTFARGVAVRSAKFEKSVDGVYPGCAGMDRFPAPVIRPLLSSAASVVNITDHGSMATVQGFGMSDSLFIDHHSFGHRFVPRGENWFLLASIAINTVLSSAISEVATPFIGYVAAALIPLGVLAALETAGSPDAVEFGLSGAAAVRLGSLPAGLGATGGMELLISPYNGSAALYGYAGGLLALGAQGSLSAGGALGAGLVWNSPHSEGYAGPFPTLSVPVKALPAELRTKLARQLAQDFASPKLFPMPGVDEPWFLRYGIYNAGYASEAAVLGSKIANGLSYGVNLFWSYAGSQSFGVSLSLGWQSGGPPSNSFSASWTDYWQLLPGNMNLRFM